jgi:arylsulfatase A-like enzyme
MNSICSKRFFRAVVLLSALLQFSANAQSSFVLTNAAPQAVPRRASIILIVADGLGYGDLSCYGQTKFQTPNLDKLAAEGILFTNYSIAGASSPSHAALLLGKSSEHLRQRADADVPLAADEITVAQILKNSGYHTGLIGEWNLGDENSSGAPWKKGFDEFAGYLNEADAENVYADYIWRYAPDSIYNEKNGRMDTFNDRESLYDNANGQKGQYVPDVCTSAALNFFKNNQPAWFNHYQPFFLQVNYSVPKAGMIVPSDAPFSEEPWPQPEKNHAALIVRLDGYIGQLTEQLQKLGMTNNAVIFFTSATIAQKAGGVDLEFFHSNISTNDLRVPMIVHWPGRIPAGQVSGFKWSPPDFLPTAAEIAFTKPVENIDGNSVFPTMSSQTQTNLPAKN